jgi:hypothetical protein
MMQNLEICVMGLFIISIMFVLCIDIIKKNKLMNKHTTIQEEEPKDPIKIIYPQYIDCSRSIKDSLFPSDYLFTDGHLSEIH